MKNRETFNFYRSFFEAGKDLNDNERLAFYDAILYASFEKKSLKLEGLAKTLFTAIKPVVDNQTLNYLNGKKGGRPKKETPLTKNNKTPLSDKKETPLTNETESYKEKEKYKEKDKEKYTFTFSLKTARLLSSTSDEYKLKLKEYIVNAGKSMSYEDFFNQCEMKPYKYKNFKMAYDSWNKDNKTNSMPMQRTMQPKATW